MLKILIMSLFLFGCSTNVQPTNPKGSALKVDGVRWSSSNPSIHNHRGKSGSVGPGAFESAAAWNKAIDKLLDDTKVNDTVSLRTYLVARRDEQKIVLARVRASDNDQLNEGGGYAAVTFSMDGKPIGISNLKRTTLTGEWQTFWATHIKGKIKTDADPEAPRVELKPEDLAKAEQKQLSTHFASGNLTLPTKRSATLRGVGKIGDLPLGEIEIDARGTITIVSLTGARDNYMKDTVEELNALNAIPVTIASPDRSTKQIVKVERDNKWIGGAVRETLNHRIIKLD